MASQFPRSYLTKLPPTPHWSLPPAPDRHLDHIEAPTPSARPTTDLAAEPAPWGACEIVLVAERQAGATHAFFHAWRFEAILRAGHPAPGTVLASRPIAPDGRQTVAAPVAPVAVALAPRADGVGWSRFGPETFTWAPPTDRDALDPNQPLGRALTLLRQQLHDAGWHAETPFSPWYHKPAPGGPANEAASTLDAGQTGLTAAPRGEPDGAL